MTADLITYTALWTAARVVHVIRPSATLTREESTVTVTCNACGDGR